MDTKILTLDASTGLQATSRIDLSIPALIPESIVNGNVIPSVVTLANFLLTTGFKVYQIAVKLDRETKIQIAYYDEYKKEMINCVVPLLAKADAIQHGLDRIEKRKYHPKVAEVTINRLLSAIDIIN